MSVKNIIVYSQTLPPAHVGGIETNAYYLIQHLFQRSEFKITVVTRTKRKLLLRGALNLAYGDTAFKAHLLKKSQIQKSGGVTAFFRKLGVKPEETVIYHNSLDLYKYFGELANEGFLQVARSGGNDLSFLQKNAGDRAAFCAAFAHLNTLFVNSNYSREKAEEIGIEPGILRVVKGGCDVTGQKPASKSALGIAEDKPVILICGRLVDFKGLDDALHAVTQLQQRGLDPLLLLVGEGPLRPSLQALAQQLGIESNCRFVGKVAPDEVAKYYQCADVYLSSSKDVSRMVDGFRYVHTETMGRSICEAQACGLPVVVTAAGGSAEMLVDRQTGIVIPQDNPAAMTDALEELLKDDELREKMGTAALAYAEEALGWEAVLSRYVEVMSALA